MKLLAAIVLFSTMPHAFGQVINEVCPSNQTNYEHPQEGFIDWIEIKNNTTTTIDLENYSISDSFEEPAKYIFESISILPGDHFLLPSATDKTQSTSADIQLKRKGFSLYFFNDLGILIDSVRLPKLKPDHSYGRLGQSYFYFDEPSPGSDNASAIGYKGYCDPPSFSQPSGLITSPLAIISSFHPEDKIYYSKNGTNASSGILYTEPISFDLSSSFQAVAKRDSMLDSEEAFRTFFYHKSHSLAVINIHVDSLAMFDSINGIYMLGPNADSEYPYYGANFWQDIELPVKYEFFNEDLELLESLECGLKIHGGTASTTKPLKSFRLVAHEYYDQSEFLLKYFENKDAQHFKRLILRNAGSDQYYTYIRDAVFHNLIHDSDLNIDAQGYRPVVVYLNANYLGVMNLREKIDKYYSESNYSVNPDSVNLLEENNLITLAGDSVGFTDLLSFIHNNNMNDNANFSQVSEHLDVKSMADYFIYQLYLNNRDWPYNNLKLWNGNSEFPKWRYLFADLDAGAKYWGDEPIDINSIAYLFGSWGDNNIHIQALKKLQENEEFKRYFINRYADLLNTIFRTDQILEYIYSNKAVIEDEMQRHWTIWWTSDWDKNFLEYDEFFSDRPEVVREDISNTLQKETAIDFYVGIYPASAKTIKLNTLCLESFPFEGQYFPDNAIDLSVDSIFDQPFLYWENLRTSERYYTKQLQWSVSEGDSLIAVFDSDDLFDLKVAPNPVSDLGTLSFSLESSGGVSIVISDLSGRVVNSHAFSFLAKGSYEWVFNTSDLLNGHYYVQVKQNDYTESIKLVVLH